ncbi:MAG: 16S rRNA (guanine(966)-N(2))-methyltransferase RsmD [Lachnospiraceae bacterium]|jgi:16S rRNA (guanine(966)-N(2))-methyltransferase RsmD|nr:16S rRNA (guanine(966)-N(2))-methyltransferase RsmD [Lachnospiraceae bacterium]
MRVIAGSARSLKLTTPKSNNTRPTTDRIKETLFNILQPHLQGCTFLDLFAGSGGIGIEALSRGAKKCVFVEKDSEALKCIKKNIESTGFTDKSMVISSDVFSALKNLPKGEGFDLIFMDPPYNKGLVISVLSAMSNSQIANKNTIIVAETGLNEDIAEIEGFGYAIDRIKEYKTNKHWFISKGDER